MIELGKGIREMLAVADTLGLPMVGIHLSNALEALQLDALKEGPIASPFPSSDKQH